MHIRHATHDDIHILIKMGAMFVNESPSYKDRGFDPDRAARHFKWLLDGNGVILLAIADGQIVGGFAGGIAPDWQADYKIAFDYVMYVSPDYRNKHVASMLALNFELWAKEQGADRIQCGTATQVNTEHTVKLYEAQGFKPVGIFLEKEI